MTSLTEQALTGSAVISPCGKYRYHLGRELAAGGRVATFIMLNPSTADHLVDDPTIRKCVGFCQRWGCGELRVVNLFAVRATDPADMRKAADPVGPENREWICRASATGSLVVCAWGMHGTYMDQDLTVLGWIADLCEPMALGVTKDGNPRHPLYVPYAAELAPFAGTGVWSRPNHRRPGVVAPATITIPAGQLPSGTTPLLPDTSDA
jgi:hypothetical protein